MKRGVRTTSCSSFCPASGPGGSNFQRWLVSVFGEEKSYTQHSAGFRDHWRDIKDFSILDGKRLVGGFSYFAQHDINLALHKTSRQVIFLSNLRHPAYRSCRCAILPTLVTELEHNNAKDLTLCNSIAQSKPGRIRIQQKVDAATKLLPSDWDTELTIDDDQAAPLRIINPNTGYSAFFMKKVAAGVAAGKGHNSVGWHSGT